MASPLLPEAPLLDAVAPSPAERRNAGDSRCRNCGAPLTGRYCADCGQLDAPPDPTLRELLSDAWDALTSVDGKLAASLRLLLARPGTLTNEFLAGRRARYLPPFRLYLMCSVAFFLVSTVPKPGQTSKEPDPNVDVTTGQSGFRFERTERPRPGAEGRVGAGRAASVGQGPDTAGIGLKKPDTEFERRIDRGTRRMKQGAGSIKDTVRAQVPNAMFLLMPLYALLVAVVYRGRRRRYPVHLVFALHVHAYFFAALSLGEITELGNGITERLGATVDLVVLAWMMAYFPLAMRRVYGGRWWATIVRTLVLGSLYAIAALTIAMIGVFAYLYVLGG